MTYSLNEKSIAVIGDEGFVRGFKLGGATAAFTIDTKGRTDEAVKNIVKETISKILENSDVGVLIVEESLRKYVEELQRGLTTPLIIYLPGGIKLDKSKIKEYYNSLIKAYLGLSIEV